MGRVHCCDQPRTIRLITKWSMPWGNLTTTTAPARFAGRGPFRYPAIRGPDDGGGWGSARRGTAPVKGAPSRLRGVVLLTMAAASYHAQVLGPLSQSPPNHSSPWGLLRSAQVLMKALFEHSQTNADIEEREIRPIGVPRKIITQLRGQ